MKDYTKLAKGVKPMSTLAVQESAKSSRASSESSSTEQAGTEEKEGFFSKIADSISEAFNVDKDEVNAAEKFADALAADISWKPLVRGGTNMCTHRVNLMDATKAQFKATTGVFVFAGLFMAIGLAVSVGAAFKSVMPDIVEQGLSMRALIPVAFGSIFFIAGLFMLMRFKSPIVFDKSANYYQKGKKQKFTHHAKLTDIHALQLIKEYVRTDKSSYYSYELNIVTKDKQRLNIVDHGSVKKMREDAQQLAGFLDVPLWDNS